MIYKGYCMQFTNEEIENGIIKKISDIPTVEIRRLSESGKVLNEKSIEPIETLCFDGNKENLFINFLGIETDIFVCNKEIMLIDESAKGIYTLSDVYHNIVYEGNLRELNHDEILQLITDFIKCFIGAIDLSITELPVQNPKSYKTYNYYSPLCYIVDVNNNRINKQQKEFENIIVKF